MPLIKYHVINQRGEHKKGFSFSQSVDHLDQSLREKGLFPVTMTSVFSKGKWNLQQKQNVFYELSSLVSSGVSLSDSIHIMRLEFVKEKTALDAWFQGIHAGKQLSQCVQDTQQMGDFLAVKILKVGEQTGKLGDALEQLAHYYETLLKLKQKIISALIYPCIVLGVSIVAILILTLYVIPMFLSMFNRYHIELPTVTRVLLSFTHFMTEYGVFIFVGIVLILMLARRYKLQESAIFFKFLGAIPIVGSLYQQYGKLTLLRTLSNLLSSDIRVHEAIVLMKGLFKDPQFNERLDQACEAVIKGAPLSDSFAKYHVLPKRDIRMIQIGEETGDLSKQVTYLANYYERKLDQAMEHLVSLFEPTMIILLSVVIGFVLIALYLPLFDILGGSMHR